MHNGTSPKFVTPKNISTMSELISQGATFNDRFNQMEDEQARKAREFQEAAKNKESQLVEQILNLDRKVSALQNSFEDSLIDPKANSVRLKCELLAVQEELAIAKEIHATLFPKA